MSWRRGCGVAASVHGDHSVGWEMEVPSALGHPHASVDWRSRFWSLQYSTGFSAAVPASNHFPIFFGGRPEVTPLLSPHSSGPGCSEEYRSPHLWLCPGLACSLHPHRSPGQAGKGTRCLPPTWKPRLLSRRLFQGPKRAGDQAGQLGRSLCPRPLNSLPRMRKGRTIPVHGGPAGAPACPPAVCRAGSCRGFT